MTPTWVQLTYLACAVCFILALKGLSGPKTARAGNLLGGEQSGHIADVGFDLYVRLVGDAVNEFKGEAPPEQTEMKIELPIDAHLPHDYVASERLRLEMYKRLAEVREDEDVDLLREEMRDRYGEPPAVVKASPMRPIE